jgi:hypothetical protein
MHAQCTSASILLDTLDILPLSLSPHGHHRHPVLRPSSITLGHVQEFMFLTPIFERRKEF